MTDLRELIRDIPDYPKPGILFYDITPVLGHAVGFKQLIDEMAAPFREAGITKVAGIEARGFTVAAPVATELSAGFIPIRKPGKLPYQVHRRDYDLEYGTDSLEMHTDAVVAGDRVLVVDDVIATGGTAAAALALLAEAGAEVIAVSVFIELGFLKGSAALGGTPFHALLTYD